MTRDCSSPVTSSDPGSTVNVYVDRQRQRIGVTPGRWAREGSPFDRVVLETILEIALERDSFIVEASDRTLAIRSGLSHTTVQRALANLRTEAAWLTLAEPGSGTRAARWSIALPNSEND